MRSSPVQGISLFMLLVFCVTLVPPAGVEIVTHMQHVATSSVTTPSVLQPSAVPPTPADAHNTGLPASASVINQLRQLYARYHRINGVFDGDFNTIRTPVYTADDQSLTVTHAGAAASQPLVFTVPIGPYGSIEYDVTAGPENATRDYQTAIAKLQVRAVGTQRWIDIDTISQANFAPVTSHRRITLPPVLPASAPLEFQATCSSDPWWSTLTFKAQCAWNNLTLYRDIPGWYPYATDTEYPSSWFFGVTDAALGTIAPNDGPFLGIESFHEGQDGTSSTVYSYRSPVLQLPAFSSAVPLTLSLKWARTITGAVSNQGAGAELLFAPVDGSGLISVYSIPGGSDNASWTHGESLPFPPALSGQRGQLQLRISKGSTKRIIAVDSITFYLDGKPIGIPADQVVGKCVCDLGGTIQVIFGDPVNTFSGAYYLPATDLSVISGGPPLTLGRTYTSLFADLTTYPATTTLGPGWRHSFADALTLPGQPGGAAGVVIYEAATGNRLRFYANPQGTYDPAPGIRATLRKADDGTYTLITREQRVQRFDAQGRLIEQRDVAGHVQTLTYYSAPGTARDGQLERVTDSSTQQSLSFTYTTALGAPRLQTVADSTGRTVSYTYSAAGDLATVTDLRGGVTVYGYDGATHLLTTVTDPLGIVQVTNQYDTQRRVYHQTAASVAGAAPLETTYDYALSADGPTTTITQQSAGGPADIRIDHYRPDGSIEFQERDGLLLNYTTFDAGLASSVNVDGNGHATKIQNNGLGLPTRITEHTGLTTSVTYRGDNHPAQLIAPDGATTALTYNDAGDVTKIVRAGVDGVQLTTQFTYTGDHRLQEEHSPDNVVTRLEYNALGRIDRQIVGFTSATPLTTTYEYDSLGRRTATITGLGSALERRDEIVYNADGTIHKTILNLKTGTFAAARPDEDIVTIFHYDDLGRQVAVQDVLGRVDATRYDALGRVEWTIRHLTPFQQDAAGQPVFQAFSAAQPDQNIATRMSYDAFNRPELVTETGLLGGTFNPTTRTFSTALERVTRTQYDNLDRVSEIIANYQANQPIDTLPDINVQTMRRYDGANNVTWERDSLGRWTKSEFDELNRLVKRTRNYDDGSPTAAESDTDLVTRSEYNALGRLQRTIDNAFDNQFVATDPTADRTTAVQYDSLGRITQTSINDDPASLNSRTDTNLRTTTAFNPTTGRVIGQQDFLARWVVYGYDDLGRVTSTITNCRASNGAPVNTGCATFSPTTRPDRNIPTEQHFDALGRVFEQVDAAGHVTRTTFDGLGRVVATTHNYKPGAVDPLKTDENVTTQTRYDGLGRRVADIDATNHATTYSYTALGQVSAVTDLLGRITRNGYDGTGTLRWTMTHDNRITFFAVDGLGRVIATITNYQNGSDTDASDGGDKDLITQMSYDAGGRRIKTIDAMGYETRFRYDLLDRLVEVQENVRADCASPTLAPEYKPCNVGTTYSYDRIGNRTAITDARSFTRTFSYDAADRQIRATDALGRVTEWTYDKANNLLVKRDPRGNTTTPRSTSYDITYTYDERDRPLETAAPQLQSSIAATYDALGRRTTLTDATGTTSFVYDALGRMTSLTAPTTGVVGYQYTARGERKQITYPGGPTVGYDYWDDGQLRTVTQGNATVASYTYDPVGRLYQVTSANGLVTTQTYDGADRLLELRTQVDGVTRSRFVYTVNRNGMRSGVVEMLPAIPTPPNTPTSTPTPTNTPTSTPTPTNTPTSTSTPTNTPTRTPTPTNTPTSTPTSTPDPLSVPTTTVDAAYANSAGGLTIIKGDRYWYQAVRGGNWTTDTLAAAWGTTASPAGYPIPTTAIDTAYFAPGLSGTGAFTVIKGDRYWYRSTSTSAWITGTLAAAWNNTASPAGHPVPTNAVDAAYFNSSGGFTVIKGDRYWYRATTTSAWITNTLSSTWNTTASPAGYPVPITAIDTAYYSPGDSFTVIKLDRSWSKATTASDWTSQTLAQQFGTAPQMIQGGSPPSSNIADLHVDISSELALHTRSISYVYDGLQRLTDAVESPGSTFHYSYDVAGNRLSTQVNGVTSQPLAYDAANQVMGWQYDAAGNLLNDGVHSYTYDPLNRLLTNGNTTNQYNGDGVLVGQTTGTAVTRYTQDLSTPLSQVLQRTQGTTRTDYLYGHERLTSTQGTTRTWYGTDGLGSVRQTLDDSGQALGIMNYDPWGTPEPGSVVPTFGFTGELQQGDQIYLRARWYQLSAGTFLGRDPFQGHATDPITLHPYLYTGDNPVNRVDPSGRCYGMLEDLRKISFEAEWCRNLDKAVAIYHHPNASNLDKATALGYAASYYIGHGSAFAAAGVTATAASGWIMSAGSIYLATHTTAAATAQITGAGVSVGLTGYTAMQAACGDIYAQTALANPQVYGLQSAWTALGDELYAGWKGFKGLNPPRGAGASAPQAPVAREAILSALSDEVQSFLGRIKSIAGSNARIGVRGSLVRGWKGPHKLDSDGNPLPFDPSNFDVDIFIVSDDLYARTPARAPGKSSRWGSEVPGLPEIEQGLEQALRSRPEFQGMRPSNVDPFEFRIWTTEQAATQFGADDTMYFDGP